MWGVGIIIRQRPSPSSSQVVWSYPATGSPGFSCSPFHSFHHHPSLKSGVVPCSVEDLPSCPDPYMLSPPHTHSRICHWLPRNHQVLCSPGHWHHSRPTLAPVPGWLRREALLHFSCPVPAPGPTVDTISCQARVGLYACLPKGLFGTCPKPLGSRDRLVLDCEEFCGINQGQCCQQPVQVASVRASAKSKHSDATLLCHRGGSQPC